VITISTRCQIGIYESNEVIYYDGLPGNPEVLLYRHSDGYPGNLDGDIGVVPDILPFLKEFMKVRGYDVEYMGACLITYLKQFHCGDKLDDKYYGMEVNGVSMSILGHGISKEFHGDIEWYYAIFPDELQVYDWYTKECVAKYSLTSDFKWEKYESQL